MSGLVIGQQWWCAAGLIYLLIRVSRLGGVIAPISLLVVVFLSGSWFLWQNSQFDRLSWHEVQPRAVQLRVYPDDIQVSGNQLMVTGTTNERQHIRAFGRLKSATEARHINGIRQVTRWLVQGTNTLMSTARNKNQFDQHKQARLLKRHGQLEMTQWQVIPSKSRWWQLPIDRIHELRKTLLLRFAALPPTLSEYATNLLLGASDATFYEHNPGLQQLGLLHLFSISGMHIVYLVGLCRFLLARCGLTRETSYVLLACLLPAYALIAGGSATLVRAVLIGELGLLQPLISGGRHQLSGQDAWSWSLIGGLFLQPGVLLSLGGQLSYLLAFTLLVVSVETAWWQTWLMNLVGLPVILHAVYQIHLLSTPINLLIIPLFGWVIFPLVILATVTSAWLPGLTNMADMLLHGFSQLITWFGQLPGLITVGKLPLGLTVILLIVTLLLIDERKRRLHWFMLLTLCYGSAFLLLHFPLDGEVSFIDIGQGDSILLRDPFNRHVSLIDTGGRVGFARPAWTKGTEPPARVVTITVNYLHSRGITTLDDVNCSHQDADHIGDVGKLLQLMTVRRLTIPAGMRQSRGFQTKIAPYLKQTQVIELQAGRPVPNFPFTIYHPFTPGPGGNSDSVVLGAERNGCKFLFMGDLDQAGERAIMQQFPSLTVDVLKLGHHGSDTASSSEFIKQVHPQLSVISAGLANHYGHPKQSVLDTLQEQHIPSLNTADVGMISYEYYPWGNSHWHTMLPIRTPQAGSPKPSREPLP
ncbi:DNA internalization-related competence protein ComEC/Rec2 [Furfurilactobacillus siliginis]|uniref:ComE operon protein 3 n=1 Tax=Furfurilactobacillus siliginis TaxID=348151 RepID=A0A0R2KZ87_9LACO|nr:DNA internalization-related competence protein ComEC/Rec2 [Furfurilactobacillus siliginis]KRN94859.1 ComE operon protein 3 [Furfurilactobacillus siliginis]GEK28430.1 DNA internalization-related competence protein ComEC/Rec2 [Furfurilactobacillus siliginis]